MDKEIENTLLLLENMIDEIEADIKKLNRKKLKKKDERTSSPGSYMFGTLFRIDVCITAVFTSLHSIYSRSDDEDVKDKAVDWMLRTMDSKDKLDLIKEDYLSRL